MRSHTVLDLLERAHQRALRLALASRLSDARGFAEIPLALGFAAFVFLFGFPRRRAAENPSLLAHAAAILTAAP